MTIPAVCSTCRERYQLADEMAGKRVRCRKCQDTFDVPDQAPRPPSDDIPEIAYRLERGPVIDHADRPRERAQDREDEWVRSRDREEDRGRFRDRDDDDRDRDREDRRPRRSIARESSGNTVVWWVLGGLGTLLLVLVGICGGIIWSVSNQAGRAVDKAVNDFKPVPSQPPLWEKPDPPAPPITSMQEALKALRAAEVAQRKRGAEWLGRQKPDPDPMRREEVIQALEPLIQDQDLGVRVAAHQAFVKWRIGR